MDAQPTAPVTYEVVDAVAVVTIDRPEVRNAMSLDVFEQLGKQAARAGADPDVRAVMVTGAGGSFSSGIDTSVFASVGTTGLTDAFIDDLQSSFTAFEELDKPVVAAIDGYCYGGGLQLAAACHLRLATPDARFSVMERRWGLIPDLGACVRLPRIMGLGHATEVAMTGRVFDAAEAHRMGFVNTVVDDADDPVARMLDVAKGLANAPWATSRLPRLMRENLGRSTTDGLAAERATQLEVLAHPDVATTMQARLEGREPDYLA